MTLASRLFAVAIAIAALLAAAAWGYAQGSASPPGQLPFIIAGSDIGFEVVSVRRGRPVGRLLVKVDGAWKEIEFAHTVSPVR